MVLLLNDEITVHKHLIIHFSWAIKFHCFLKYKMKEHLH